MSTCPTTRDVLLYSCRLRFFTATVQLAIVCCAVLLEGGQFLPCDRRFILCTADFPLSPDLSGSSLPTRASSWSSDSARRSGSHPANARAISSTVAVLPCIFSTIDCERAIKSRSSAIDLSFCVGPPLRGEQGLGVPETAGAVEFRGQCVDRGRTGR
jgi:hypothetical protein